MRKTILLVLGVVLALGGGLLVAEQVFLGLARDAGVRWFELDRSAEGYRLGRVTWRGVEAAEVEIPWAWPLEVFAEGIDLDIASTSRISVGGSSERSHRPLPTVHMSGVGLRWGDQSLAQGLSGVLEPGSIFLEGDGIRCSRTGERTELTVERESPLDELVGAVSLHLELEGEVGLLTAESTSLEVNHPFLASHSVPLNDLSVRIHFNLGEDTFEGRLSVQELQIEVSGSYENGEIPLRLELPATAVETVLEPLAGMIPELANARVTGEVEGWLEARWPAGDWRADGRLKGLGVEGAVPRLEALRYGPFEYQVRNQGDEIRLRTSGEGSRGWTPLRQIAPSLVDSVQAAEDSGFLNHQGYDLEAIREAMMKNQAEGRLVRGGSTLTQQLAKNLFLDGERTLSRKLRELLLAVEMDRVLGKSRVLELYLNVVEWGPGFHGVAAASERYFMRSPARLQTHEAAFLAAILPAPRTFYDKWYLKGRAGDYRIGWVLQNMADGKSLTAVEAARWAREPLRFVPPPQESGMQ